jgi:hypothetical protein
VVILAQRCTYILSCKVFTATNINYLTRLVARKILLFY